MQTFDITSVPQDILVAFYGLSFATAAGDGSIAKEELLTIFEMIDVDPLDDAHKRIVQGYVLNPPAVQECLTILRDGTPELRFAVVVGVVEVILADDIFADEEKTLLEEICRALDVNEQQKDAIINFVKESRRLIREGVNDNKAEKALKGAISGLTSVGVPIAAVYFSGSVIGLSAAGITSGLAALGLGLGMVPGIGVAVVIGAGVFFGLKALLGDSKAEKAKALKLNQERKAQMVIRNLQESISALLARIVELEAEAQKAEENAAAIASLRDQLVKMQAVLKQRQAVAA